MSDHLSFGGYSMQSLSVMGLLLWMNVVSIYELISNKTIPFGIFIALILLTLPYAIPSVFDKVMAKYEKESERSCLIGNTVVVVYITASIISFIMVAKIYLPLSQIHNP